jgi:hypothetical protein
MEGLMQHYEGHLRLIRIVGSSSENEAVINRIIEHHSAVIASSQDTIRTAVMIGRWLANQENRPQELEAAR